MSWSTSTVVARAQVVAGATIQARLEHTLIHILTPDAHQLLTWLTAAGVEEMVTIHLN